MTHRKLIANLLVTYISTINRFITFQGLLRFAMEATRAEDAPHESQFREMDPERRRFLEEALRSLTIDVVEQMQKAMNVLIEGNATQEEQVRSLEVVTDFIENIDTANDFYKIGGFCILLPCLSSAYADVRQSTAELVAELAQNNPFCQERLLEHGVLPKLFELLSDESKVAVASLHAISCLVRNFQPGLDAFLDSGGIECLIGVLDSGCEKLVIKSAFLISTLCGFDEPIREQFVKMGALEKLSIHVAPREDYDTLLESVLSAIFVLIVSKEAVLQSRDPKLGLLSKLEAVRKTCENKEEFQECIGYTDGIIEKCFPDNVSPDR